VRDELVDVFEAAGIEQEIDPLARGELARLALPAETVRAPAQLGAPFQAGESVLLPIH
jgi:hypothetical protein